MPKNHNSVPQTYCGEEEQRGVGVRGGGQMGGGVGGGREGNSLDRLALAV